MKIMPVHMELNLQIKLLNASIKKLRAVKICRSSHSYHATNLKIHMT